MPQPLTDASAWRVLGMSSALLMIACGASAKDDARGAGIEPGGDRVSDSADPSPTSNPAFPTARTAPRDAEQVTWRYPVSDQVEGSGSCAGVTLAGIVRAVHQHFDWVAGIDTPRLISPAAPGNSPAGVGTTPAGQPPATASGAYYLPLMDEHGFALVFFKGEQCHADDCETSERWYFETDEQCRPRWAGYYKQTAGQGCLWVEGEPLWLQPDRPKPRSLCDVDLSPQEIAGEYPVMLLGPGTVCGADGQQRASEQQHPIFEAPATLRIVQTPNSNLATATITGSGLDFIDGVELQGPVERKRLVVERTRTQARACGIEQHFSFYLDFEEAVSPPFFATLDVTETASADCTSQPACVNSLSLHFTARLQ